MMKITNKQIFHVHILSFIIKKTKQFFNQSDLFAKYPQVFHLLRQGLERHFKLKFMTNH